MSEQLIERLPRYSRYLNEYFYSGAVKVSSREIAKKMGITPSQVRNDLGHFSTTGQQGYGYNTKELYQTICDVIGFNTVKECIIVGAGNIGKALIGNKMFQNQGFRLAGVFDMNTGETIKGWRVMHVDSLKQFLTENKIDIAIISTPSAAAQTIADEVTGAGVMGILNFSYTDLKVPHGVTVENVHIIDKLMELSYRMAPSAAPAGRDPGSDLKNRS